MRRTLRILLLAAALPVASLAAQAGIIPPSHIATGRLSFDAHATAGDFTGATTSVAGGMTGGSALGEVRGCVQAPAGTLVTGNGHRDRDLNKSMETERFPTLRFRLREVVPADDVADSTRVNLIGDLTLHGVTRLDTLPARLAWRSDSIEVRTDFPVNVKDHGVRGLSKLLGMFKMNEHIVVHVDVIFVPGAEAADTCRDDP